LLLFVFFFFQAEDGIRDPLWSRGLGDVYPIQERIFADPAPGELLAPDWAADKDAGLHLLRREMARKDTWQGRLGFCPDVMPDWNM